MTVLLDSIRLRLSARSLTKHYWRPRLFTRTSSDMEELFSFMVRASFHWPVWAPASYSLMLMLDAYDPDLSQTAKGNASFRAFRLTAAFFDAWKRSNFSTAR